MSEHLLDEIIPDNVEQYLKDEHFHHSLRGCKCVVLPISAKDGNRIDNGVYKKCLTHNVDCSKTGWELGHYLGNNNKGTKEVTHTCECGKQFRNKYGMCFDCLKEKQPKMYKDYYKKYKLKQAKLNIITKMKLYGIPEERWEEKLKDYEENYYCKGGSVYTKLKDFWKK
jgi:hypothetical protein